MSISGPVFRTTCVDSGQIPRCWGFPEGHAAPLLSGVLSLALHNQGCFPEASLSSDTVLGCSALLFSDPEVCLGGSSYCTAAPASLCREGLDRFVAV